jgi:hypothetical protein
MPVLDLCYLCATPATQPLDLKESFTAHSSARCPTSTKMCDRCHATIAGNLKQCWYWNEGKQKWSAIWTRNTSWLLKDSRNLYSGNNYPYFGGARTEGGKTLAIIHEMPTRSLIRQWLLSPPKPPFTIAIAESGQKHILPWSQEAQSREFFPVTFELDLIYIDRENFSRSLKIYERLMAMGFTKGEIDSGDYRSEKLMKCMGDWQPLEDAIAQMRGGRLLQLISYVALVA